jgi:hypothetical protein
MHVSSIAPPTRQSFSQEPAKLKPDLKSARDRPIVADGQGHF